MADFPQMMPSQVALGLQELDRLADVLCLPDDERCGILGLSWSAYRLWQSGLGVVASSPPPALVRRLGYALPLIRRMAENGSAGVEGYRRNQPHPAAG